MNSVLKVVLVVLWGMIAAWVLSGSPQYIKKTLCLKYVCGDYIDIEYGLPWR